MLAGRLIGNRGGGYLELLSQRVGIGLWSQERAVSLKGIIPDY